MRLHFKDGQVDAVVTKVKEEQNGSEENNFEEQLTNLEQIVQNLENGNVPLEDALKNFRRA